MHQCECKESDHTINEQIINSKLSNDCGNKSFSKSKCNYSRMKFSLSYANETREKKRMQLLIFLFKVNKANKQNRAYRGRFVSFKEMCPKKLNKLRSTWVQH